MSWTTRGSVVDSSLFSLAMLFAEYYAESWGGGSTSPGTAQYAHFNDPPNGPRDAAAAHALDYANRQLAAMATRLAPTLSPKWTQPDGTWFTVSNTDQNGWTQGFFPGANWYVYDLTGDPAARSRAVDPAARGPADQHAGSRWRFQDVSELRPRLAGHGRTY